MEARAARVSTLGCEFFDSLARELCGLERVVPARRKPCRDVFVSHRSWEYLAIRTVAVFSESRNRRIIYIVGNESRIRTCRIHEDLTGKLCNLLRFKHFRCCRIALYAVFLKIFLRIVKHLQGIRKREFAADPVANCLTECYEMAFPTRVNQIHRVTLGNFRYCLRIWGILSDLEVFD